MALLKKSDTSHVVLPESDILWYPQAPFANWEKQNESCEEASASLLYRNTHGVLRVGPEDFDAELDHINAFEESQGIPKNKVIKLKSGVEKAYVADLSIEQIADLLLEKYFHFKSENVFILTRPTTEQMESLLDNNFMLIVPVNTFEVNNHYANHATYHVMPIVGYDDHSFLSLDVSTKKGFKLPYEKNLLLQSIHNNSDRVLFVDSPLASLTTIRNRDMMAKIDTKAQTFKTELQSRLRTLPASRQTQVLEKINNVLIAKITSTSLEEKKMLFKKYHLVVAAERLQKPVQETVASGSGSRNAGQKSLSENR